ncbi:PhzF family phenazine biosynthesis protein [Hymenobacter sp. 15J16-1T3B]|uniref:PhzF family phenazine biosynthesis protein n=1 Tax=Hymenobacter sp. 15J16-1T3B TaxID=2886941 RepID=UPI001D11070F|nr:PhzF family phenazine biosynthesis protein [Hymenobacter sp. 15J16-1T3B]MCC3160091.1 PhzF family phenazine biosynthesis protein [Hymenobacter sp. 15J16-1T3B]
MPTSYPFLLVDAFTTRPLGGNPCAVVLDADDLSPEQMQRLAREFNQSETAFVRRASQGGAVAVRYFTPAEEIPLAGHPTIATAVALVHAGRVSVAAGPQELQFELRDGPIRVGIAPGSAAEPLQVTMTQRPPVFGAVHDAAAVLPLFGLTPADVLPGAPVQTVSTGTPQLMILLRDHAALRRARTPEAGAYAAYRQGSDFFSPHLFCLGGATPAGSTFARHFGTPPDILEDPVTGSATGAMAAYLHRHGYLTASAFVAEQGHWLGRPGTVHVRLDAADGIIRSVQIAGTGVVLVEGRLTL